MTDIAVTIEEYIKLEAEKLAKVKDVESAYKFIYDKTKDFDLRRVITEYVWGYGIVAGECEARVDMRVDIPYDDEYAKGLAERRAEHQGFLDKALPACFSDIYRVAFYEGYRKCYEEGVL